jgi:hypothetical protein
VSSTAAIQLVQKYGSVEEAKKHAAEAGVYAWEFNGVDVSGDKVVTTDVNPVNKANYGMDDNGNVVITGYDSVSTIHPIGPTIDDIVNEFNNSHKGTGITAMRTQLVSAKLDGTTGIRTEVWSIESAEGTKNYTVYYQFQPGGDSYTQEGGTIYRNGVPNKKSELAARLNAERRAAAGLPPLEELLSGTKGKGSTQAAPGLMGSLASAPAKTGSASLPTAGDQTTSTIAELVSQLLAQQGQSTEGSATLAVPAQRGYVPIKMRPRSR